MKEKVNLSLVSALCVAMIANLYLIFVYAPIEKTMGAVQKIFYFHVASAWVGMFAFVVVFAASIKYLLGRDRRWNALALSSAEIGTLFTTMVLVTGPLRVNPIWKDHRLTTTLVLWFMYLAYIALQGFGTKDESRARFAAVYGIIAFVNVPLVFFSIRWWRTIHPVVISAEGVGLTSAMFFTMFFSMFTFSLLYACMLRLRYRTIFLADEARMMKEMLYEKRRDLW